MAFFDAQRGVVVISEVKNLKKAQRQNVSIENTNKRIPFDRPAPPPRRTAARQNPRLLRRGRGELYEIEKIITGKHRLLGRGASFKKQGGPMIKKLIERFPWKKKEDNNVQIKKTSLAKRFDTYAMAAAFAEVGLQDAARELLQERPKILVVGKEDQFSDPLIDYAIGFAKRMTYDIIALSCAPIDFGTTKQSSPYYKEMFKNFQSKSANSARFFAARAEKAGIHFRHVVESGNVGGCIRKMENEINRLQFVLKDLESPQEVLYDISIPVFVINK